MSNRNLKRKKEQGNKAKVSNKDKEI